MSRPMRGPLEQRQALRRGGRSLRQGRQGDTLKAIAPDAAAPIEACCKADGLRFVLDVTQSR
jgi:hypothetical protein